MLPLGSQEHGTLSLADDVTSFFEMPGEPTKRLSLNNPYSTASVNLGQMASQTSGIFKGPPASCFTACSEEDYLDSLVASPLVFAPGSRAEYSNAAFALLGHAAARAADPTRTVGWEEHLVQGVLSPLGMARSGFFPSYDGVANTSSITRGAVWGKDTSTADIEANTAAGLSGGKPTPPQASATRVVLGQY